MSKTTTIEPEHDRDAALHRLPEDLLAAISAHADVSELRTIFADLLTPRELSAVAERWEIVKRLDEGMTQRAIRDVVGASVTTVSRGNRQLREGFGGFRQLLETAKQNAEKG